MFKAIAKWVSRYQRRRRRARINQWKRAEERRAARMENFFNTPFPEFPDFPHMKLVSSRWSVRDHEGNLIEEGEGNIPDRFLGQKAEQAEEWPEIVD